MRFDLVGANLPKSVSHINRNRNNCHTLYTFYIWKEQRLGNCENGCAAMHQFNTRIKIPNLKYELFYWQLNKILYEFNLVLLTMWTFFDWPMNCPTEARPYSEWFIQFIPDLISKSGELMPTTKLSILSDTERVEIGKFPHRLYIHLLHWLVWVDLPLVDHGVKMTTTCM